MGKKAKMTRQILAPEEASIKERPNGPTSTRCRETHDVPFTLRCTLDADHVTKVIREEIIQSGEWAGAMVRSFQPHVDKDGRQW